MNRAMCYRCFWPQERCWCGSIQAMDTRTRFLFLMHPKEYKRGKAGTGRLTHLSLRNSEIQVGVAFDDHEPTQAILADPANYPMLLYPGKGARNLSQGELSVSDLGARQLVVILLDGTWSAARKMLRVSRTLQALPRVMFTPTAPSRYVIKQQPDPGCLSTLEAAHQTLDALHQSGLDNYEHPDRLLSLFDKMQAHQIECAADPDRGGYRRQPYGTPQDRARNFQDIAQRRRYVSKNAQP